MELSTSRIISAPRPPSPDVAAVIGFAAQTKPVRFESAGASALRILPLSFYPGDSKSAGVSDGNCAVIGQPRPNRRLQFTELRKFPEICFFKREEFTRRPYPKTLVSTHISLLQEVFYLLIPYNYKKGEQKIDRSGRWGDKHGIYTAENEASLHGELFN